MFIPCRDCRSSEVATLDKTVVIFHFLVGELSVFHSQCEGLNGDDNFIRPGMCGVYHVQEFESIIACSYGKSAASGRGDHTVVLMLVGMIEGAFFNFPGG